MIIFLYGEDTYRLKEKLGEIIEGYKKAGKSGLDLKYINCLKDESNIFNSLKNDLGQASMFKEKKLIIILNAFSDTSFKEDIIKEKSFINSEDIIVFYQEGNVKKNDSLFKHLEKNAKCQNFELLNPIKLKSWMENKFLEYGARISSEAGNMLFDFVGNDLWRLNNEIQKLAMYKKRGVVEGADVKLLVKPVLEVEIFKTIDALAQRDKKQALRLIHKHLAKGESPIYLLSMINYQFRNLLIIKDFIEKNVPYASIAKRSGLHPFVIRKSHYQCQQFSLIELKKIYLKIFQADLDVKTGKTNPEAALEGIMLSC
jgi:DNA polymerase III delta subunit